jgi:hypothetical protein
MDWWLSSLIYCGCWRVTWHESIACICCVYIYNTYIIIYYVYT